MKKIFFFILATVSLCPEVSWALDCIKFENMEIKILKQEHAKVYLQWKAKAVNRCEKMVSIKAHIHFADEKGRSLQSSFEHLNFLTPGEVRSFQGEKDLASETFYKTAAYNFKASAQPDLSE
ncbi:MAG: hypothetical protein NPINA01_03620 [Nitrospinaceae bacterium]|nr:MAG: hypothetical protein NPINA01_03620 [Nitrospinaceae bacterium]